MISIDRHLRTQLFMVVAAGAVITVLLSSLVESGRATTVAGWCLAVFWTLALIVEAIRRSSLRIFPETRLTRRMHVLLLVLNAFLLLIGTTDRLLMFVLQFRVGNFWLEYAILRMVTDSYGNILIMVLCIALGMTAADLGVMVSRATMRAASEERGVGRVIAFTAIVLNLTAMIAAPIQDWNNADTFFDKYIDSWYMDVYIDAGPIQIAMYAVTGCIGAYLIFRWLRSATRLSAIRTLSVVVVLWSAPFVYQAVLHGVDDLLLGDRGDFLAWTTMMLPFGLFGVASLPALKERVVLMWRGAAQ